MMRVLVDGLNTLPEKLDTKGLVTYEWGRRVNLEDARTWELHPNMNKVAIAGFVTKVDNYGQARRAAARCASSSSPTPRKVWRPANTSPTTSA